MKTQYYTASSLDGFIADEHNSLDWLMMHGEPEDANPELPDFMSAVGAAAMGSTTYEWLLEAENLLENPEKWMFHVPTWVFSSRDLTGVEDADIRFVRGDVAPVHDAMRRAAGSKNVWLVGGGDLVGQFYDQELLDEIIVTIAPVTLGAGAPLLPRRIVDPPLVLTHVRQSSPAFAELTYSVRRPQMHEGQAG